MESNSEVAPTAQLHLHQDADAVAAVAEATDTVIEWAEQQRMPLAGEPVCVVCSRYGAYVCDQTERDVCSKQCKEYNLWMTKYNSTTSNNVDQPPSNYDHDAYYRQYYGQYYYGQHQIQAQQHPSHPQPSKPSRTGFGDLLVGVDVGLNEQRVALLDALQREGFVLF